MLDRFSAYLFFWLVLLSCGFLEQESPSHLAYVDWFTPFSSLRPGSDHGLYKIS